MATLRFSKPTMTSFGIAKCCLRPLEVCAQSKERSEARKCDGRDIAYDKRRARLAAKREQRWASARQHYQEEKEQRAEAKRRRLQEQEESGVDRRRPCDRFWKGKCARVFLKCGRRHGTLDEAAQIYCASCPGPNFEEGWVCSYTERGDVCPFLHGDEA